MWASPSIPSIPPAGTTSQGVLSVTHNTLALGLPAKDADPPVLRVAGDLDHHTAPRLREALASVRFAPGEGVVVELSGLAYCDSTGITVLVTAYRRAHATSSPLFFTGTSSHLMRVFHTVGLDKIFTFQPTTEHVLKALPS